jgi:hypothetical protein
MRGVASAARGEIYACSLGDSFLNLAAAAEAGGVLGRVRPSRSALIVLSSELSFVNLWLLDRL